MPLTNAQTVTAMADTTANPTRVVAANDTAEMIIHLRYDGVNGSLTLDPNNIFLAIRGASSVGATKIASQHGNQAHPESVIDANNGYEYTFVITA